ncbi:unnamed protein product, partial [Ectocarpus sp. 13 AM-2016]
RWRRIEFPATATIPAPRSGHQMAVYAPGEQIFLYGGYSKEKEPGQKKEGKTHNDMWVLNMKPAVSGGNPTWDRIGKKGAPPSIRSGAAMTVHKNRALLFGGVLDHEGPQHALRSVFYNDLFAFDMERRRWYHLALKKAGKKKVKEKGKGKHGTAGTEQLQAQNDDQQEEEEEDYIDSDDEREDGEKAPHENAFVYIDESGKLVYVDPEEEEGGEGDVKGGGVAAGLEEKESSLEEKEEKEETKDEKAHAVAEEAPSATTTSDTCSSQQAHGGLEEKQDDKARADGGAPSPAVDAADVHVQLKVQSGSTTDSVLNAGKDGGGDAEEASPCPLPRINPCLTVRGNTLYVYGGLLEVGDREFTLDDCWSLELNTRVAWKRVQEGTMDEQMWKGEEDESEMGSEWGEEESDSDDDDDDDDDGGEEVRGL